MSEVRFRDHVAHPSDGKHPGLRHQIDVEDGLIVERDAVVPMRDGTRLYADVIRPEGSGRVPVIVTFSPYGKHGPKKFLLSKQSGVPEGSVSKYAVWEGPDPDFFCRQGYAIVNADARGSWYCEGDLTVWSDQEAQDGYDLIEWAAAQPWSTGKVGTSGVSYLAIVQWRIAALRPPHLAAINPWEGWSDCYRERVYHGGIPETQMVAWAEWSTSFSLTRSEELVQTAAAHPLLDDYWRGKAADLPAIDVPAYIVADWGDHGLHTRGTIEGFRQIASAHKWLEIHGQKKWEYYYRPENRARLLAFFDHFLKGTSDEVLAWPKVRIEIRDAYGSGTFRDEADWPLARTAYTRFYLDAGAGALQTELPAKTAAAAYDARIGSVTFDHVFAAATELTGYAKLRLWIEADGANDADLFVALQKIDRHGDVVPFAFAAQFENGPVALGWLRASHRELDPERSTDFQPWLLHAHERLLEPGEIVPVDIEILPSSTRFAAGERLRLVVQGHDIYAFDGVRFTQRHDETRNCGRHIVHTGGVYESYVLVPVIPDGAVAEQGVRSR